MTPEEFKIAKSEVIQFAICELGETRQDRWSNVLLHTNAVRLSARALGWIVKLPLEGAQNLELEATLHDAGKRRERLGLKSGKYASRKEAEEDTHARIASRFPNLRTADIRSTSPGAMIEYLDGGLSGEENLIARLLFFADEIVDGKSIVGYKPRINAWEESLKTVLVPEYGFRTQMDVETQFSQEVEDEIRERSGLNPNADLIKVIQALLRVIKT